jgi:hypothetical protein
MTKLSDKEYDLVKDLKDDSEADLDDFRHDLAVVESELERLNLLVKIFGREGLTEEEREALDMLPAEAEKLRVEIELLDDRNGRLRRILRHGAIVD